MLPLSRYGSLVLPPTTGLEAVSSNATMQNYFYGIAQREKMLRNVYGDYLKPVFSPEGDVLLDVECGENRGLLYLSRFCQGSKGPCIRFDEMWLTPNEFQYVSGRESAKDWKRSIRHQGKSLKLLLAKGILTVHPSSCSCTGCRISSPVNRGKLSTINARAMYPLYEHLNQFEKGPVQNNSGGSHSDSDFEKDDMEEPVQAVPGTRFQISSSNESTKSSSSETKDTPNVTSNGSSTETGSQTYHSRTFEKYSRQNRDDVGPDNNFRYAKTEKSAAIISEMDRNIFLPSNIPQMHHSKMHCGGFPLPVFGNPVFPHVAGHLTGKHIFHPEQQYYQQMSHMYPRFGSTTTEALPSLFGYSGLNGERSIDYVNQQVVQSNSSTGRSPESRGYLSDSSDMSSSPVASPAGSVAENESKEEMVLDLSVSCKHRNEKIPASRLTKPSNPPPSKESRGLFGHSNRDAISPYYRPTVITNGRHHSNKTHCRGSSPFDRTLAVLNEKDWNIKSRLAFDAKKTDDAVDSRIFGEKLRAPSFAVRKVERFDTPTSFLEVTNRPQSI